jgi:hypothetical protein
MPRMTICTVMTLALTTGSGATAAARQNPGPQSTTPQTTPQTTAPQTSAPLETAPEDAPGAKPRLELSLPKPNQGHYVALGLYTLGAMAFDDDRGTRQPTFGTGFGLRLGEAVTDWLDLGLAFAIGSTQGNEEDALSLGRFTIHSQWYVSRRWFLQAGFGATNGQGSDPDDLDRNRGRYGDVYIAGLGANLYLSDAARSGGWVLSPAVTIEVGPDRDFTTTALWLGLEVSWWSGLSRDKLELPLGEAYE